MTHEGDSDDLEKQTYTLPLNGRCLFPESSCSSHRPPDAPLFTFSAKASNLKLKPQVQQRQDVDETSFSKSLGYLFNTPAVNLNFSGSNNSFNLFNVKGSQKDSPKTSVSENSGTLLTTAQKPEANAAALSFGVQTSLTASPVAAPPVAVLSQHSSGASTEHTAPTVFSHSSGKESSPSLKNRESFFSTVFLEKPESQNSNINPNGCKCPASTVVSFSTTTSPRSDSTDSGKPFFPSVFPVTSESGLSQLDKRQNSFSPSPPDQNKNEENQHKENNFGHSSGKKLIGHCNLTDNVPYKPPCCVPVEAGASEKQSAPSKVSANYFWETNITPTFSFPGSIKNNQEAQASSMTSADKTKSPSDKSKIQTSVQKHLTARNASPSHSSKDFRNLMNSSSFFFMKKLKSETENIVPQENVARDSTTNKTVVSGNLTELSHQPENSPRNEEAKEDHVGSHSLRNGASMINAESDREHSSQASNSNDSHTPSEYFSVAEEKMLPR